MRRHRIERNPTTYDKGEKRGQMFSTSNQRSSLSHFQRSLTDPMVQQPLNSTAIANQENDLSWGGETLRETDRSPIANGPFTQSVNAALTACFGPEIAGLQANFGDNNFNASIGARTSTLRSAMLFGEGITQNMDDRFSMEVIGKRLAISS
ncbi:MAG: hypothetical protein NPIRA04_04910 [Nitrospirales bacterium]|nr:MAG: hypothetical protein NPIRA04_04910 [Nitrospirales bacterium]